MGAMSKENANRINEIADQITDLIYEAGDIIRSEDRHMYDQFKAYTLPHVVMNVKKESDWMGSEMFPLDQFAKKIENNADEDENEDEEEDADGE